MRILNLKTGVLGLIVSQIVVLALLQTTFAKDVRRNNDQLEIVYEGQKFGLGRMPIPNDQQRNRAGVFGKRAIPNVNPTALVYSAYTSYTDSNGGDTFSPWVYSNETFLFVAFRVTGNTKVKIRWNVEGPDEAEKTIEFVDQLETDDLLNPDYWYFAWWQPDSLSTGLYDYSVRVKPTANNGKAGKDACQFEVVE